MASCGHFIELHAGGSIVKDSSGNPVTAFVFDPLPPDSCAGQLVISTDEFKEMKLSIAAFGWDENLFFIAFGSSITLFAIGLGIGLIISTLRKLKT